MLNTYIFDKSARCPRKAWYLKEEKELISSRSDEWGFPMMPKNTEYNRVFKSPLGECIVDAVVTRDGVVELYDFHPSVKYAKFFSSMNYKRVIAEASGETVRHASVISVNPEYLPGGCERPYVINRVPRQKTEKDFIRTIRKLYDATKSKKSPKAELGHCCAGCEFFEKCFRLPKDNIFKLVNLSFEKKMELYNAGIITFDDYLKNNPSPLCETQINGERGEVINKKEIKKFLNSLKKPLGFLDFETIMPINPEFEGYRPNERVVTQFSFHRKRGTRLTHCEYIGNGISCPEENLIRALITAAGESGSILMYSPYERICIETLIERFPEYKVALEKIKDRLVDLEYVFKNKLYYNKNMRGRSSLKIVVSALFEGDKELNYSLGNIVDGADAAKAYSELKNMKKSERNEIKKQLLTYCGMDTLALVRIIEKLEKIVKKQDKE